MLATANAFHLTADLAYLKQVIQTRLDLHAGREPVFPDIWEIPVPDLEKGTSIYANLLHHYGMQPAERICLLLALAPHVQPQLLDPFYQAQKGINRGFAEFGGIKGQFHGGFLPTGETILFVLAGEDLSERFEMQQLFDRDHFFASHRLLKLDAPPAGEPRFSGALQLSAEILDLITQGEMQRPDFSKNFPARLLRTEMLWDDLVLNHQTLEQLRELDAWLAYGEALMVDWEMGRKLKPGYKALFHGPPGTGKTLTATLIGQKFDKETYRIDLSSVVSKYIGETEKNLERIFDRMEHTEGILFFDEADALFGKRTNVSDAHDRYANQEVSYLLQRIEDYPGLVILASNFKSNLDDAFLRRFQAIVHFPLPNPQERLQLWQKALPPAAEVEEQLDWKEIAERYKMAGGSIMNVMRYASLMALQRKQNQIRLQDIMQGIRRELAKEGKSI
jgi:hypothetical protein